jgi:hypothetical protein
MVAGLFIVPALLYGQGALTPKLKMGFLQGGAIAVVLRTGYLLFFVVYISKRRNWARFLFLASFLWDTAERIPSQVSELPSKPFFFGLSVALQMLSGTALVLLFHPSSTAWFKSAGRGNNFGRGG